MNKVQLKRKTTINILFTIIILINKPITTKFRGKYEIILLICSKNKKDTDNNDLNTY